MKAKPHKCHFVGSSNKKVYVIVEIEQIINSTCEKPLGSKIDAKLYFIHISTIFAKQPDRNYMLCV